MDTFRLEINSTATPVPIIPANNKTTTTTYPRVWPVTSPGSLEDHNSQELLLTTAYPRVWPVILPGSLEDHSSQEVLPHPPIGLRD